MLDELPLKMSSPWVIGYFVGSLAMFSKKLKLVFIECCYNRLVRLELKKVVVFVGLDGQEKSQTSPLFCPDGQGLFQKITFDLLK